MNNTSAIDTSILATRLLRIGAVIVFVVVIGRLYFLQILLGDEFLADADENRIRQVETQAARGIIYDANGEVLVQNEPTFQISIVPDNIPFDDILTDDVDEEAEAIREILMTLRADERDDVAIRLAELMFQRLGRRDFTAAVEDAESGDVISLNLPTIQVPNPNFLENSSTDDPLSEDPFVEIPDLSEALPVDFLVAAVQKTVAIGRLGSSSEPILLLDSVSRLQAFFIAEESYRLGGLQLDQVPVRDYIYKEKISHILGFMGPIPAVLADEYRDNGYKNPNERVGISGLELAYQDELRGTPGLQNLVVDLFGSEKGVIGDETQPVPGQSLHLSLNMRLQRKMDELLQAMMDEQDAPWGVTITMDPRSGGILGMVSLPSFDNNIFSASIPEGYLELQEDERKPLINYAIGGLYPPGSVFKMVTASAALRENIVTPQYIIRDDGPIYLPNRFLPDDRTQDQEFVSWNHKLEYNHGPLNVVQALALSNDIYFYFIGGGFPPDNFIGLGDRLMADWASEFSYGESTGIDLPGEVAGLVPDDEWKRRTRAESWTTGDSYNVSIGQGDLLATPLQVLVATAAIANGGIIYEPQLVHHTTDVEGNLVRDFEPKVKRELTLDPWVIDVVQQGMWAAVNSEFGTAIEGRIDGIEVAGKTGTAEFCEWDPEEQDCRFRDEDDNLPTHAWYVAYAPYDAPEVINVTFVYRGGEGSEAALPVATEIIKSYFSETITDTLAIDTPAITTP